MGKTTRNFFWASYADLMTALFIVTLVLFVLSYRMFTDKAAAVLAQKAEIEAQARLLALRTAELDQRKAAMLLQQTKIDSIRSYVSEQQFLADSLVQELENERGRLLVMEIEYRKLKEIEKSISSLDPKYFKFQPAYKRHVLTTDVQFETGRATIRPKYQNMLINAGKALQNLIKQIDTAQNIKYMLVIEGSASKDNYSRNYELSYARALELHRLWARKGISFDKNRIEIIIAGSGTSGIGRVVGNERKNQRFLIQIIPKVGTIELSQMEKAFSEKPPDS